MQLRARAVGLTNDDSLELSLTQEELGGTMGLSTIHTRRRLRALRGQGLITSEGRQMIVHDVDGLMAFSGIDANHLHPASRRPGSTGVILLVLVMVVAMLAFAVFMRRALPAPVGSD